MFWYRKPARAHASIRRLAQSADLQKALKRFGPLVERGIANADELVQEYKDKNWGHPSRLSRAADWWNRTFERLKDADVVPRAAAARLSLDGTKGDKASYSVMLATFRQVLRELPDLAESVGLSREALAPGGAFHISSEMVAPARYQVTPEWAQKVIDLYLSGAGVDPDKKRRMPRYVRPEPGFSAVAPALPEATWRDLIGEQPPDYRD